MKDGKEGGKKIAGFDFDSQSGAQEPQPHHSYCSAVNPALYSAGTLQLRRNNSGETEEMTVLVDLSCRTKMVAFQINTHLLRKIIIFDKNEIPNVLFSL